MHKHFHTTSKLSRQIGPRRALVKNLADSLILYEKIKTTEAKAKTLLPYFEKIVTRAKAGQLADIRAVYGSVDSPAAAQKLVFELAEAWRDRLGGYARIIKISNRAGDNAPMVIIELNLPADFGQSKQTAIKSSEKSSSSAKAAKATRSKAKTQFD